MGHAILDLRLELDRDSISGEVSAPIARGLGRRWAGVMVLALAACVVAVSASPASAAFIYTRGSATTQQYVYAGTNTQNEQSVVIVREIGANYHFFESGPGAIITSVDFRCTAVSPAEATCPIVDGDGEFFTVDAELHDGSDSIDMRTTSGSEIDGGAGSDMLKGGSSNDQIQGDADFVSNPGPDGSDFIDGRGGADHMFGDGASDTVSYASRSTAVNVSLDNAANDGGFGEGDDVESDVEIVRATSAGDTLTGDGNPNQLVGLEGFDVISGLGGPDTLEGGDTGDNLDGGSGIDTLTGESGGDTMRGGTEADSLDGGGEDDTLLGGAGADDMRGGGGGADTADYAGATDPLTVTANDDAPNDGAAGEGDNVHSDVERIFGGAGNDTLEPIELGGEIWGREGNDTLLGHNSDDRLEGGDGDDTLDGRFGADVMNGGGGIDTVNYADHYFIDDGSGDAFGVASAPNGLADDGNGHIDRSSSGNLTFDNVGSDIENLIGSGGPDVLQGTFDANEIAGGLDDDTLEGGLGPDELDGGAGVDTASYAGRPAPVRVTINDLANDGDVATNESDNVTSSVENVRGGSDDDSLTGSGGENRLIGGNGDDALNGGLGADVLDGQGATDTLTYSNRRATRIAVTLDGLRNDGADPNANGISTPAEEGDRDIDIENATGGKGPDILTAPVADSVRNILRGLNGNDTLDAREGTTTVDALICGPGGGDRFAKDPSDTQSDCEVALP